MKRWIVLFFLGGLGFSQEVLATGTAAGAASAPDSTEPLKAAVAIMADKKERKAPDYEQLALETLKFGSQPDSVKKLTSPEENSKDPQAPWRDMVGDALAGVDEGERLDAKAADWPKLREDLKKLQPPPPPPSSKKHKSDRDKKKDKGDKDKDKKSGKGKGEPKDSKDKGENGEKGDKGDEGEGDQDSKTPPTPGSGGGKKQKGGKEGESQEESPEGEGGDQPKSKGKDPSKVKDFSSSKEGEGKMKERTKEEDLAPMQSKEAGFGSMGEGKDGKEGKDKKQGMAGGDGKKEKGKEAPEGMRMVGGGSGQKENSKLTDPLTQESLARLEQVRQSDNPALIQQRLQPKDQRASPSSNAKPY